MKHAIIRIMMSFSENQPEAVPEKCNSTLVIALII